MCPQVLQTPAQLPLNVHRAQSEAGTVRAAVPGEAQAARASRLRIKNNPRQLACPTQLAGHPPCWTAPLGSRPQTPSCLITVSELMCLLTRFPPSPQRPGDFSHCCPSWTGGCCPSVPRIQVPAPPSCPRQGLLPISHPREQQWEHPCPNSSTLLSIPPTALARLPHTHFPKTGLLSRWPVAHGHRQPRPHAGLAHRPASRGAKPSPALHPSPPGSHPIQQQPVSCSPLGSMCLGGDTV